MNTITLEANNGYFNWTCDVCGELQNDDGMNSQVNYNGDTFDICRTCLDAGPDGTIKRGAEHADRLQKYVDALRTELPEVIREIAEWKTGADYDGEIEKRNAEFTAQGIAEGWLSAPEAQPVNIPVDPETSLEPCDEFPF